MRILSLFKVIIINSIVFLFIISIFEIASMIVISNLSADTQVKYPPVTSWETFAKSTLTPEFIPHAQGFYENLETRKTGLSRQNSKKEIFFWGGSMTFGDGVLDNETYPYYIEIQNPDVKTYNGGISGFGPELNLLRLQTNQALRQRIAKAKKPISVYYFIDDHINRVSLNLSHAYWSSAWSLYQFKFNDKSKKTISGQPLHSQNFAKYFFIQCLKKSYIFRLLNLSLYTPDNSLSYESDDIKLTARVIAELRNEFLRLNPQGRFYFVSQQVPFPEFTKELRNLSIEPQTATIRDNEKNKQPDGHYTNQGNKELSRAVSKVIGLQTL